MTMSRRDDDSPSEAEHTLGKRELSNSMHYGSIAAMDDVLIQDHLS